jgi:hypothetical protein
MASFTYEIRSIDELVKVGCALPLHWFRGQCKVHSLLTPSVFRPQYQSDAKTDIEAQLVRGFRVRAPMLSPHAPNTESHLEWLFLMQHHGTPTRLLDWSESILVAAFFCCYYDPGEDGEIWAMRPRALNRRAVGSYSIPFPWNPRLAAVAHMSLLKKPTSTAQTQMLKERYGISRIPEFPIAFFPPVRFSRLAAQLGCFTIHPSNQPGKTITDTLNGPRDLMRYIVEARTKPTLLREIAALGIVYRSMFPDLDGLSRSLRDEWNSDTVRRKSRKPPTFGRPPLS